MEKVRRARHAVRRFRADARRTRRLTGVATSVAVVVGRSRTHRHARLVVEHQPFSAMGAPIGNVLASRTQGTAGITGRTPSFEEADGALRGALGGVSFAQQQVRRPTGQAIAASSGRARLTTVVARVTDLLRNGVPTVGTFVKADFP